MPRKKAVSDDGSPQPQPAKAEDRPPVTPETIAQAFERLRQRANNGDGAPARY